MEYKKYYNDLKDTLKKFSDVIYYEPMQEEEISEIEKSKGVKIKPMYREFLTTFGLIQDVFEELKTDKDSLLEDFNFSKDNFKGYIPIYSDIEEDDDVIFLIKNDDLNDEYIYSVNIDIKDEIGEIKKRKSFIKSIEGSISDLESDYKDRCPNSDKINLTEFTVSIDDFQIFLDVFEPAGLKQKTNWGPKYYPENVFGDEVAIFELNDTEIIFERDDEHIQYSFDMEESIFTKSEDSIIIITEKLLNENKIEYKKLECKLIEND